MLVSTVGPFAQVGRAGVRAGDRGQGRLHRLDRRAAVHPPRVRRVRAAGRARGRGAADRDGLRLRAGRAGGGARAGGGGRRRRCASTSATTRSAPGEFSAGTRRSAVGIMLEDGFAFRGGRCGPRGSPSGCARSPSRQGPRRDLGRRRRALHASRASYPGLREVNVYLGWFPALARAAAGGQPGRLGGDARARRARALKAAGDRLVEVGGSGPDQPGSGISWIVGEAYDAGGEPARRGAPVGRRAVRAHRRHPRLGGAPRRRRRAWTAPGRSARCRRSGCARSRRAAARRASTASATQPPCERADPEQRARDEALGLQTTVVGDLQPRLRGRWPSRQRSSSSLRAGRSTAGSGSV